MISKTIFSFKLQRGTRSPSDDFACLMTVVDDVVSVVVKADKNSDVAQWRGNSMTSQYLAGLYDNGAVIALKLTITEPSGDEIEIVPMLNTANQNDADLLRKLAAQNIFHVHFLKNDGQYIFSKRLDQGDEQRRILRQLMARARQHNQTCRELSWDDAQQQFIETLTQAENQ